MHYQLSRDYLSLRPFEAGELPALTILTGENGAGKSHFLRSIASQKATLTHDERQIATPLYVDRIEGLADLEYNASTIDALSTRLSPQHGRGRQVLLEKIAELAGVEPDEVGALEIESFVIDATATDPSSPFAVNLAQAAMSYRLRYCYHLQRRAMAENEGKPWMSDADWRSKYGEDPVTMINQVLAPRYEVRGFDLAFESRRKSLKLELFNQEGTSVTPSALSGGEQIMFGLVVALFNGPSGMPDALLLDEVAAPLHPRMMGEFLTMLSNRFVKGFGLPTILTTHSPSLVAVAEDHQVHLMESHGERHSIRSISRDDAIGRLTAGVPALRVSVENRRQVFVEDQNDVTWFEGIYEALRGEIPPAVGLSFVATATRRGLGRSGASAVSEMVRTLASSGAPTVRGVIDWDGTHKADDVVAVLAEGRRYAIENCILDPLAVAAALARVGRGKGPLTKLTDFVNPDELRAQESVNEIENSLIAAGQIQPEAHTRTPVEYCGGLRLSVADWYLRANGHELVHALLRALPALGEYAKGGTDEERERRLMTGIVSMVFRETFHVIPIEFRELFVRLQQAA